MGVLMSDESGNLKRYAGNILPTGYAGLVTQINNMKAEIDNKVEKVDVVYDMSGGSTLDWGYPSGIPEGYVTGKDFTKYKKLIVYWQTNYICGTCEIDLTKDMIVYPGAYSGSSTGCSWDGNQVFYGGIVCFVKDNKTTLACDYLIYFNSIQAQDGKKITKIEGVY